MTQQMHLIVSLFSIYTDKHKNISLLLDFIIVLRHVSAARGGAVG
jgi:hypothetical protein